MSEDMRDRYRMLVTDEIDKKVMTDETVNGVIALTSGENEVEVTLGYTGEWTATQMMNGIMSVFELLIENAQGKDMKKDIAMDIIREMVKLVEESEDTRGGAGYEN